MTGMRVGVLAVASAFALAAVVMASAASADDRWEGSGTLGCNDDSRGTTCNVLAHGIPQTHDLQGITVTPDQDWMIVHNKGNRSYEVRIRSTSMRFRGAGCTNCAGLDRVHAAGGVLTAGYAPDPGSPQDATWSHTQTVRWLSAPVDQREFIRLGTETFFDLTANDQYEIELLDTTYFVPRWNQSGTQSTVLIVQNISPSDVEDGGVLFYDGAGTLLEVVPLNVPFRGVQVIQGASFPTLAGRSGSAAIVHTAGWGALAGKAVALEPATGYSFDTPFVSSPR